MEVVIRKKIGGVVDKRLIDALFHFPFRNIDKLLSFTIFNFISCTYIADILYVPYMLLS